MPPTRSQILEQLAQVLYPGFGRDLVSLGVVRDVEVRDDTVRLRLVLAEPNPSVAAAIERAVREALGGVAGVAGVQILTSDAPGGGSPALKLVGGPKPRPTAAAAGGLDDRLIPQVRHTVAVASGKGGVGKSTVAVNLAAALARSGATVGLLDADIYGPSIPLMTGLVDHKPRLGPDGKSLIPFERFGVRLMSLGFLVDPGSAVIWRGPMVMKAIEQLLRDVAWGALDVLVVDMPPGTGDAQLTLSQRVRLAGAVIVTTPQDVALADAIKGVAMFRKVGVPVLGMVENMSFFECPHCHERSEIFGHGGGRQQAERLAVPLLAEIPLDARIRASGDAGRPVAAGADDTPAGRAFTALAERVLASLADGAPEDDGDTRPAGLFERFRSVWQRDLHD